MITKRLPTNEENKLAQTLIKTGIKLKQQYEYDGKTVDIFIPDVKLTIEVDGGQHLTKPEQILSDFHREYHDELKGIHTLHIPNEFIRDEDWFNELVKAIVGVIDLLIKEMKK
jgi:very-short-patch-repair endonuclease